MLLLQATCAREARADQTKLVGELVELPQLVLASLGLAKQNWQVNQLLLNATGVAAAWIYPCADRAASIRWT